MQDSDISVNHSSKLHINEGLTETKTLEYQTQKKEVMNTEPNLLNWLPDLDDATSTLCNVLSSSYHRLYETRTNASHNKLYSQQITFISVRKPNFPCTFYLCNPDRQNSGCGLRVGKCSGQGQWFLPLITYLVNYTKIEEYLRQQIQQRQIAVVNGQQISPPAESQPPSSVSNQVSTNNIHPHQRQNLELHHQELQPQTSSESSTDPDAPSPTGPSSTDALKAQCKEPRGQFPSESSCNKFINCWDETAVEQTCPAGLVFNPEKRNCDYPANLSAVTVNATHKAYKSAF
ncbi:hypothetical protein AGLY_011827 [Aphis glycines]|uniref:Chitin-binding type-2 domain-containing protein n=1 Tax=Aphis glycines TaxID=307491 RepID=A0A6G0TBX5_APHGL|nr:hypothetical protein AGLY_011827 [Aphis glycines]